MKFRHVFGKVVNFIMVIAVLFCITACDDSSNVDSSQSDPVETVTILVPAFDSLSEFAVDRGLTDMFNDDTYFSCFNDPGDPYAAYKNLYLSYAVMTTTPITPSLKPISNVTLSLSVSLDYLKAKLMFDAYGFHIVVDDLSFDLNKKTIMIKYNVVEADEVVGIIDYAYNWKEKTFSYRECVMLTLFGPNVPAEAYTFGAIVLEMHDVKLETDVFGIPTGSYTTGDLTNGSLEKNAFVDMIEFTALEYVDEKLNEGIKVSRDYLTISSKNGLIFSMVQPAAGTREVFFFDSIPETNPVKNGLSEFYIHPTLDQIEPSLGGHGWTRKDLNFNWSVDPHSFDVDFMMNVFDVLYSNSDIFKNERAHDVSDYPELRTGDSVKENRVYYGERFVAYDVDQKVGAGTQLLGNTSLETIESSSLYEQCNFNDFDSQKYRSYPDGTTHSVIADGLIEDHLRNCGIKNENYLENFKLAYKYSIMYYTFEGDREFVTETVTTEDPSLFKARLDSLEVVEDQKNSLIFVETRNNGIHRVNTNNNIGPFTISGTYTKGSFVTGSTWIQVTSSGEPGNLILTSIDFKPNKDGTGDSKKDEISLIVIPRNYTSVDADFFDGLSSLQRLEVSSNFDQGSLPEEIRNITVVID